MFGAGPGGPRRGDPARYVVCVLFTPSTRLARRGRATAVPHTGIQDAKDHLESLDELRKGATDDLAKLARKQHEDPAVILHPEKRGEVEEVDPVQKGEDRRAASNARKEALLEAKRKQEEERARLAEKRHAPGRPGDGHGALAA